MNEWSYRDIGGIIEGLGAMHLPTYSGAEEIHNLANHRVGERFNTQMGTISMP